METWIFCCTVGEGLLPGAGGSSSLLVTRWSPGTGKPRHDEENSDPLISGVKQKPSGSATSGVNTNRHQTPNHPPRSPHSSTPHAVPFSCPRPVALSLHTVFLFYLPFNVEFHCDLFIYPESGGNDHCKHNIWLPLPQKIICCCFHFWATFFQGVESLHPLYLRPGCRSSLHAEALQLRGGCPVRE